MTLGQISHLPQGLLFSNDVFKTREDLAWLAEKYIQNRKPFHYKMYRPYRHTGTPTIFDKSYTNNVLESVSFLKSLSNSMTTNENIQKESMKVVSPVEQMELGNKIHFNVLEYTTKKMEDVIPAEQQITESADYSESVNTAGQHIDQSTESATVEPTINGYRPIITQNYKDLDQYTATTASSSGDIIYTTTTEDVLVAKTEAESSTTEIVDTLNFTNKDLDESAEPIAPEIEYVSEHNAREKIGEYKTSTLSTSDEATEHPTNPPSAEIKIVSSDKHEESTNLIYKLVYPTKSLNLQKFNSRTPTSPIVELVPSPEVFVLWKDPTL